MQQLLQANGNIEVPAFQIKDNTVEMKASDLNKLFQQSFENLGNAPQNPWNIRESAAKYRDSQRQQQLQNLFASNQFSKPVVPDAPWKIQRKPASTSSSSSIKQQQMEELKKLLSQAKFNDIVPEDKWNIRTSSLRFKNKHEEEDELTAPIPQSPLTAAVAGSGLLSREQQTYLQRILENHGLMRPTSPDPDNKWNIRESGEKYRKVKFKIHANSLFFSMVRIFTTFLISLNMYLHNS